MLVTLGGFLLAFAALIVPLLAVASFTLAVIAIVRGDVGLGIVIMVLAVLCGGAGVALLLP